MLRHDLTSQAVRLFGRCFGMPYPRSNYSRFPMKKKTLEALAGVICVSAGTVILHCWNPVDVVLILDFST